MYNNNCIYSREFSKKPVTVPALEVVTLAEQKLFSRIDGDYEDTLIQTFINSATSKCESYCNGGFALRDWEQNSDIGFLENGNILEIKNLFIRSVSKLYLYDIDNAEYDVDSADFEVLGLDESLPARILFNDDYIFPTPLRIKNAFKIEYSAGKTLLSDLLVIFPGVQIAIMSAVSTWYEFRETIKDIPEVSKILLDNLRIRYR